MRSPITASPQAVRRLLLHRQLLSTPFVANQQLASPEQVLSAIRVLEAVQLDPVAAVERNHHLVLAARVPGYHRAILEDLLAAGKVFEYEANAACVLPMADYPVFKGVRARMSARLEPELRRYQEVANVVRARLERDGPLTSRQFQTQGRVRGYWDNQAARTKTTSHVLNLLRDSGVIRVTRRVGTERFFDLAERGIPRHILEHDRQWSAEEADRALLAKYLRAFRVFDAGDPRLGWRRRPSVERHALLTRLVSQGELMPFSIDGIKRPYYLHPEDTDFLARYEADQDRSALAGHIRFLPPLDNHCWRRERLLDLFGFAYTWEVYLPPVKRRFGYYAMPILAGDRLIGRLDPRLDRQTRRLLISLLQLEPGVRLSATMRTHLMRALDAFKSFHDAEELTILRTDPPGVLD